MLAINIHPVKNIRYAFFPSLSDKTKDPVLLWLTGGPGCSSLLATFHENGPFTFEPGTKKLSVNPQTWNKRASLLYLELPAGVGYSEGP
jgi:carboxypeptidase C (cathepsin A)